jgi:4-hydroxy-2-oxoglutarate aldolase
MDNDFRGIFPALSTPFVHGEISPEKLKENIQKYNAFDLSGYVVLGSTGESVYLSDGESEELVQAAKESASPEKKIIVGTARESTKITLEFTNRMAALDIDAALIRNPSYFTPSMTHEVLKKHYLTLADKAKVPVIIYNIPQYTGVWVDIPLMVELSHHPNILGMKDSSGSLVFASELIARVSPRFSILLGAGSILLSGLIMGAGGGILRLASLAPSECSALYKLWKEGKIEKARSLQLKLIPANKAITTTLGIAGLKYALDLLGYYGGEPRFPLLPLDEKEKEDMKNTLQESGLL